MIDVVCRMVTISARMEKSRDEDSSELAKRETEKSNLAVQKLELEKQRSLDKQQFLEKILEDSVELSKSAIKGINEIVSAGSRVSMGINALGDRSQEIIKVVDMISSIADETNLLSLNATIEAARSHGAGKGFNVIAGEIKQLAKTTKEASRKVSVMIESFKENFETVAIHIDNQGSMAEKNSIEINRFQEAFQKIIETVDVEFTCDMNA